MNYGSHSLGRDGVSLVISPHRTSYPCGWLWRTYTHIQLRAYPDYQLYFGYLDLGTHVYDTKAWRRTTWIHAT